MAKAKPEQTPRIRNKKARRRFEVFEKIDCGMALQGTEVKSLRVGQASLDEAYALIKNGEAFMVGCHIAPYDHGNVMNHEPTRTRKLLLRRREITRLSSKVAQKGLTLIPLSIYFNDRGLAKVTLGLARTKVQGDKRQDMRKREHQREMERARGRGGR